MKSSLKDYVVKFSGLSIGNHHFSFEINESLFNHFGFETDFDNPMFQIDLNLEKHSNFLQLDFSLSGAMDVLCDLSGKPFNQKFESEARLIIKFGEFKDTEDDEVWVIPLKDHEVDLSQYLYEFAVLSLPKKRIHPNHLNDEKRDGLIRFDSNEVKEKDPRWEALKNLKFNS